MSGALLWSRLRRHRGTMTPLAVLVVIAFGGVLARWFLPYSPIDIVPERALQSPSAAHWMGTDHFGRDVLARVVHGGWVSIGVAAAAVVVAMTAGVPLGLVAGYYRGWVGALIMRATDVLLAFPSILLALLIVVVLEPGAASVAVAVGIAAIPQFVRVTRGIAMTARASPYSEAARVAGASDARIMWRHVLPNLAGPLVVLATVAAATALLTAAALSFLGLGPRPPEPEWGAMLSASRDYLRQAPWQGFFPGLAITVTALTVNLLGDGLRDALDPRL